MSEIVVIIDGTITVPNPGADVEADVSDVLIEMCEDMGWAFGGFVRRATDEESS